MNNKESFLEHIENIGAYVPMFLGDPEKETYVGINIEIVKNSIEQEFYQTAWIYINIISFIIWYSFFRKLKVIGNKKTEELLQDMLKNEKMKGKNIEKIFDLSLLPENLFLDYLGKICSCFLHANEIDEIKRYVNIRNDCSHASGLIQYNIDDLPIPKVMQYIKKVQDGLQEEYFDYVLEIAKTQEIYFLCIKDLLFSRTDIANFYIYIQNKDLSFEVYNNILHFYSSINIGGIYAFFDDDKLLRLIGKITNIYNNYNDFTLMSVFEKNLFLYNDHNIVEKIRSLIEKSNNVNDSQKEDIYQYLDYL